MEGSAESTVPFVPISVEDARKTFTDLDKDGSGGIDLAELRAGLQKLGFPSSRVAAKTLLKKCDSTGTGAINFDDFYAFLKEREKSLWLLFQTLDQDSDGQATPTELRAGLIHLGLNPSSDQVASLMKAFDLDGDGKISFTEFRKLLVLVPGSDARTWMETALMVDTDFGSLPTHSVENVPPWKTFVAGGVAGTVSRTATAPLDRLKTILQAQSSGEATGVIQGMKNIYKEGGWKAYFRGNGTNVIKIAPETALRFFAYDKAKAFISADPDAITVPERLMAGALAGMTAQIAIYPLELTKTRLAVSPAGTYDGITGCITSTVRKEGLMSLYRGLGPSIAGIIPYAGVDLCVFSYLKDMVAEKYPDEEPGVVTLLACGATSSTCGQVIAYPLQLIRTRLQTQGGPGRPVLYQGALDCLLKTLQQDGVRGLYRGIGPNFLKTLPAISLSYTLYELCKTQLKDY